MANSLEGTSLRADNHQDVPALSNFRKLYLKMLERLFEQVPRNHLRY